MDEQPVKKDSQEELASPTGSSQPYPDTFSPEDYLRKSDNLLDRNHPEAVQNNFLLFSPLLPVIAFIIVSLGVIGSYVSERQQQVADTRSKAQTTPCAAGSNPRCIHPGDSCGANKVCVNGQENQQQYICYCLDSSQIPVVSVSPTQLPTLQTGIPTREGVIIAGGIIVALCILILWRRKRLKHF